ncbi:MAG: hypothetical protein AAFW87_01120 [Pseudomonadota bacterium]
MTTAVIVALMVIFGAALIGKMLKDMYPGAIFGRSNKDSANESSSVD